MRYDGRMLKEPTTHPHHDTYVTVRWHDTEIALYCERCERTIGLFAAEWNAHSLHELNSVADVHGIVAHRGPMEMTA